MAIVLSAKMINEPSSRKTCQKIEADDVLGRQSRPKTSSAHFFPTTFT
jgi:hypothetical protein